MGYGGQIQHAPPQIHWGRENEDAACKCYKANRKVCDEDVNVSKLDYLCCQRNLTWVLHLMEGWYTQTMLLAVLAALKRNVRTVLRVM